MGFGEQACKPPCACPPGQCEPACGRGLVGHLQLPRVDGLLNAPQHLIAGQVELIQQQDVAPLERLKEQRQETMRLLGNSEAPLDHDYQAYYYVEKIKLLLKQLLLFLSKHNLQAGILVRAWQRTGTKVATSI